MHFRPLVLRLISAAAALLVVGGAVTACSSQPTSNGSSSASVATGSHLEPTAFATSMTAPNTVIVDVRTPSEFTAGHIAGATNIDVEAADFANQITSLDKTKTYAVYCHSGRRSAIAMQSMQQAGFTSVYDLNGGIQNWQAAGLPLVTN